MSIVPKLQAALARGELVEHQSMDFGDETARTLYVSSDIVAAIQPPFAETTAGERLGELRGWLDSFALGGHFTVAEDPNNKPPDVMLARVSPVEAEFWSIRVTEPEETPGIRILGAFIDTDAFVALTWDYREDMTDFDGDVESAIARWKDLFGDCKPLSAGDLDGYLTNYDTV